MLAPTSVHKLLVLASTLDTVPAEKFDYRSWTSCGTGAAKEIPCGATACAFGWACTIPEFRAEGLRLNASGSPVFGDAQETYAAAVFFGIPYSDAVRLFVPGVLSQNASAQEVASHIRKYVINQLS